MRGARSLYPALAPLLPPAHCLSSPRLSLRTPLFQLQIRQRDEYVARESALRAELITAHGELRKTLHAASIRGAPLMAAFDAHDEGGDSDRGGGSREPDALDEQIQLRLTQAIRQLGGLRGAPAEDGLSDSGRDESPASRLRIDSRLDSLSEGGGESDGAQETDRSGYRGGSEADGVSMEHSMRAVAAMLRQDSSVPVSPARRKVEELALRLFDARKALMLRTLMEWWRHGVGLQFSRWARVVATMGSGGDANARLESKALRTQVAETEHSKREEMTWLKESHAAEVISLVTSHEMRMRVVEEEAETRLSDAQTQWRAEMSAQQGDAASRAGALERIVTELKSHVGTLEGRLRDEATQSSEAVKAARSQAAAMEERVRAETAQRVAAVEAAARMDEDAASDAVRQNTFVLKQVDRQQTITLDILLAEIKQAESHGLHMSGLVASARKERTDAAAVSGKLMAELEATKRKVIELQLARHKPPDAPSSILSSFSALAAPLTRSNSASFLGGIASAGGGGTGGSAHAGEVYSEASSAASPLRQTWHSPSSSADSPPGPVAIGDVSITREARVTHACLAAEIAVAEAAAAAAVEAAEVAEQQAAADRAAAAKAVARAAVSRADGDSTSGSDGESCPSGPASARSMGSTVAEERVVELESELDEARNEVSSLRSTQVTLLGNLQKKDLELKELTAQLQATILQNLQDAQAAAPGTNRRSSFGALGRANSHLWGAQ